MLAAWPAGHGTRAAAIDVARRLRGGIATAFIGDAPVALAVARRLTERSLRPSLEAPGQLDALAAAAGALEWLTALCARGPAFLHIVARALAFGQAPCASVGSGGAGAGATAGAADAGGSSGSSATAGSDAADAAAERNSASTSPPPQPLTWLVTSDARLPVSLAAVLHTLYTTAMRDVGGFRPAMMVAFTTGYARLARDVARGWGVDKISLLAMGAQLLGAPSLLRGLRGHARATLLRSLVGALADGLAGSVATHAATGRRAEAPRRSRAPRQPPRCGCNRLRRARAGCAAPVMTPPRM